MQRLARSRFGRRITGWLVAHASPALPLKRVHTTRTLVAFHHPRPSYPLHILIVPRRARCDLTALSAADSAFMVDLFATVRLLVERYDLARVGYRLIANGGPYQDVPQLHFHLIAETPPKLPDSA
jgi:histidine triad (HIT) family protein